MIRSSQRIYRISMCALIGGLGLAASAWAGPLGSGSLGAGGYGGVGFGHGVTAGGMAGGYGEFGLGDSVAARGAAGARAYGGPYRPGARGGRTGEHTA